jgi:hypothetical protein
MNKRKEKMDPCLRRDDKSFGRNKPGRSDKSCGDDRMFGGEKSWGSGMLRGCDKSHKGDKLCEGDKWCGGDRTHRDERVASRVDDYRLLRTGNGKGRK